MLLAAALRIAGIGDGLFILIAVFWAAVAICFLGAKSRSPALFCFTGFGLFFVLLVFFIVVPKEETQDATELSIGEDEFFKRRIGVWTTLLLSMLLAVIMMIVEFLAEVKQATKVRMDVS